MLYLPLVFPPPCFNLNSQLLLRCCCVVSRHPSLPHARNRKINNAVQGLSKPSDSSPPVGFPPSELDKLRDLPVWKTLSGKRVAVDRQRHFSLAAGGDVAHLPLPPGASDRCVCV